ncbi:MAG: hemolysin family protein [Caldilineaceae bacterium]
MEPDPLAMLIFLFSLAVVWFAVAMELALTVTNRSAIREMSDHGDTRAAAANKLLQDPERLLLTSMLLKTIGLVAAGASMTWVLPGAATTLEVLAAIVLTWAGFSLVMVIGRASGARWPQTIALRGALLMRAFNVLLFPAYLFLRQVGEWLGGGQIQDPEGNFYLTEEGLRLLMEVGDEEPILDSEKQMIASILELDETVAREVMVPRIDVVALDVNTGLRDALDVVIEAGHSRLPVYEGDIDHIVGFLYAKDLLRCFQENRDDMPINTLLRPVHFVPETKKINALLREMQKRRVHVSMVVDEYGGTAGLVTIEDLIEEIVGEIQDEYDEEEDIFVQTVEPDTYLINARYDLYSLSKLLEIDLSGEDADTLGGLIYSEMGHVPEQGESVVIAGWRFTVLALDGRRIDQVRAEPVDPVAYDGAGMSEDNVSENHELNYSLFK